MILHFLDKQMNHIETVDTSYQMDTIISELFIEKELVNGTAIHTASFDIYKTSDISEKLNLGKFLIVDDLKILMVIMAESEETEYVRPVTCYDLGVSLRNGSAVMIDSRDAQYIDYYVNREIAQTDWEIGRNELGTDIKKIGTFSEESPLSRLQSICELFNCEMSFRYEFSNLKVTKKYIDISYSIGVDRSNDIHYSGEDVVSISKSSDIYNFFSAIRDQNQGFNDLVLDDGRFFTIKGESIIYDRQSNTEYGYSNTSKDVFTSYTFGNFSSSDELSPQERYKQGLDLLKASNSPTLEVTVNHLFEMGDLDVGDTVIYIDEEFKPALRVKARVKKITMNDDQTKNEVELSNYELLQSQISSDVIALQQQLAPPKDIYLVKISSDSPTSIKDNVGNITLTATVYHNGRDITPKVNKDTFVWTKQNEQGIHDEQWEANAKGSQVVIPKNSISEKTDIIKCQAIVFETPGVQAIYFINGLKSVTNDVLRYINKEMIVSAFITDIHFATDTAIRDDLSNYGISHRHVDNVVAFSKNIALDYIVGGGDLIDGSTYNKTLAKRDLTNIVSRMGNADCPYFSIIGNHEFNSWGDGRSGGILKKVNAYQMKDPSSTLFVGKLKNVLTMSELYQAMIRPSTIFSINDSGKGYYYYDVPDKNFRAIFLNSSDIPLTLDVDGYAKYNPIGVSGYRQEQIDWLKNVLLNTPTSMTVGVYQHFPFGRRYDANDNSYPYNYEMIDGLLSAFKTGGSFTRTYSDNVDFQASVSVNFNGRKGTVAFLMHGHTHKDRISLGEDGIHNVSTGCSVSRPKHDMLDRSIGTLSEDLWDVVAVDTKNRKVKMFRFGSGEDREFSY